MKNWSQASEILYCHGLQTSV